MNILKRIKNKILSSREDAFEQKMRHIYKDELLDAPLEHDFVSVHFNYKDKKCIYLCQSCHNQFIISPLDMFNKDSHIALLNDTTAPCKPKNSEFYKEHDVGGEG